MPSIREFTPPINPAEDAPIKLQVWVSQRQKRSILAAFGDDGAFTFIIRTQFTRLYDFILTHDLDCNSPADIARLIAFVRNGTDTRPDRTAAAQHDAGTATRLQHKDAAAKSQSGSAGTGSAPRVRKQGKGQE